MQTFDATYKRLNKQQRLAVDTIEGPVMVIAGPGTGKTQLLSVRVANILKSTDTKPDNILCLTFTDAAATEMRNRLVDLIGQEGYGVNVMTFHSFGSEVISRFPEFFYSGAHMQPIDDISAYALLRQIFESLGHSNPLSVVFNDEYTYLKDTQTAIGQLKKAAISPDELNELIKHNQKFIDYIEPIIVDGFGTERLSKKTIPKLEDSLKRANGYSDQDMESFIPLSFVFCSELERALETGETPPISEFKKKWLKKDSKGTLVLKDRRELKKLSALSSVYKQYQGLLNKNHLYDYDDMVMNVVREIQDNPELKAELQEQYLYLLVDEFQDTNDAQLKLLKLLADNPVHEGRPNILVVGDDDQAIYKFQGAEVTNMHQFASWVTSPLIIPLTDIYRYPSDLLDVSTSIISNSSIRVTDTIEGVDKQLQSVPTHKFTLERLSYDDEAAELDSIAQSIAAEIKAGTDPSDIAVIARQHSQLEHFSIYANHHKVPLSYDRRDNVLDEPMIKELIHFARVVLLLADGKRSESNALMPELLSYRFWGIKPADLWDLNRKARASDNTWIDCMLESKQFKQTAQLLLDLAQSASNDPLNIVLDGMIGTADDSQSPFYGYYFSSDSIDSQYLQLVANLKTLKLRLQQFNSEDSSLHALISFIDLQQQAGAKIVSNSPVMQAEKSVQLLSAHKAKGQEFDHVYIIHAIDSVWGSGRRGRSSLIKFPHNVTIAPAGDNQDDRVRLFYVATTRAKKHLTLSSSRVFNNKPTLSLRLLEDTLDEEQQNSDAQQLEQAYILDWSATHTNEATSGKSILKPYLDNYRLSITHLQNFVDVTNAGPTNWLLYNLLKLPAPTMPPAAYGSAVHATLNEAQNYLVEHNTQKGIPELLSDFTLQLSKMHLSKQDYETYQERGDTNLKQYLEQRYNMFSAKDKSEVNLYNDNIIINTAYVTGLIDKLIVEDGNLKNGEVSIADYKTGKPALSWKGKSEFEKLKLHRYKQQLMFYELLLKKSSKFSNLKLQKSFLEFVEPDEHGDIHTLVLDASQEDYDRLVNLIGAVWNTITKLELPDISKYPNSLEGILAFEDDLIAS